ncbi:MAG: TlyA family RNA methyltransferase [Hyphomicrobiales bacterium]|nr:TlyA family RNA methyltransferase [Hyphomicrobiales bacterium]
MTERQRIDRLLVARGVFDSRARAQAAIAAGCVTADGLVVARPSEAVATDAVLAATPAHPWVSRGGIKLAAALDHFQIDPSGLVCLDVGASTGGFSDVLLARGARLVYAVDVGRGQLHPRLRVRSDIISLEQTDIRNLDPTRLAERADLAVIDASFISLRLILPALPPLLRLPCRLVALIKPQFEAGPGAVHKGIVRDPAIHAAVCDDIAAAARVLGWQVIGIVPSPIAGGDGNREFLLAASRG